MWVGKIPEKEDKGQDCELRILSLSKHKTGDLSLFGNGIASGVVYNINLSRLYS